MPGRLRQAAELLRPCADASVLARRLASLRPGSLRGDLGNKVVAINLRQSGQNVTGACYNRIVANKRVNRSA